MAASQSWSRLPGSGDSHRADMVAKGQRYRTKREIRVTAMTSWAAPFTGGYERVLRAGEVFTVADDPPATATAVYCDAAEYKRLHREMIPLGDRLQFWSYRGFYLCIALGEIETGCELLEDPSPRTS